MKKHLERLEHLPAWGLTGGGLLLCGLIGWLDAAFGRNLSIPLLYVPVVVVVAWRVGFAPAAGLAFLASALALIDDGTVRGNSHVPAPLSETAVRLLVLLAVAGVVHWWHREVRAERRHDPLTGLLNSRGFLERAEAELNRSRRTDRPLSVVFLDGDGFKAVNDRLGHLTGDAVLKTVASVLDTNTRGYDVAARWGGDEFALLLPESDEQAARAAIARLQEKLRSAMQERSWPVTFSIGVVTFRALPESAQELVREADRRMYAAKEAGGDRAEYGLAEPSTSLNR